MITLTNLTAVLSAVIVTSYSTNVVSTDNAEYHYVPSQFQYGDGALAVDRCMDAPPTERYERTTITEHKTTEVTLTNGTVLRQELTNRVVSDRIRTFRIITTEEFVDEKDAPQPLDITTWGFSLTNAATVWPMSVTNTLHFDTNHTNSIITIKP